MGTTVEHPVCGLYRCSIGRIGIWRTSLGRCLFPPLPALSYADVTASRPVPRFQLPPHRTQRADVGIAMRCAASGGGFPFPALSIARWVHNSTIAHVSASLPAIPDGRISRVRFWPRPCTPFSDCMSSHALRNLSVGPHTPRPAWFFPESRPTMRHSQTIRYCARLRFTLLEPPSAQSPFAWFGCCPFQDGIQCRLGGCYSSFIAHMGSCASPNISPFFPFF